jgi:hypothetical protein
VHRLDVEAVRGAVLAQQRHVALAVAAEMEVVAHHHTRRAQTLEQHPLDERQR